MAISNATTAVEKIMKRFGRSEIFARIVQEERADHAKSRAAIIAAATQAVAAMEKERAAVLRKEQEAYARFEEIDARRAEALATWSEHRQRAAVLFSRVEAAKNQAECQLTACADPQIAKVRGHLVYMWDRLRASYQRGTPVAPIDAAGARLQAILQQVQGMTTSDYGGTASNRLRELLAEARAAVEPVAPAIAREIEAGVVLED